MYRYKVSNFTKTVVMVVLLLALVGCGGVAKSVEKEYYMDVNNYITEEAVVDTITYDKKIEYIGIRLSEISDVYQGERFIIEGENLDIVLANGILEKIEPNSVIEFTSAPAFFGNGYLMPIVQLSVNGETLLSFEEGYANLLKLY
ncbi:MAG: hypothetical protein IKK17_04145 [Oscillospiraceae bacterium]|nr:hypothetical protein [Oscillospiraceae bacterium]